MKIIATKVNYKIVYGDRVKALGLVEDKIVSEIKIKTIVPCCDKMAAAMDGGAISFGNPIKYGDKNAVYIDSGHPDTTPHLPLAISFCPFCAESIEIELIQKAPTPTGPGL